MTHAAGCRAAPHSPRLAFTLSYVAPSITHFISLKVSDPINGLSGLRSIANSWRRSFVPVIRMEMVIHVATKVLSAMKPGTDSDEHTTGKPFGAVVAVGSAGVRRGVIVAVRTVGSNPNVHGDLGVHFGSGHENEEPDNSSQGEIFKSIHYCCPHLPRDTPRCF